MAVWLSALRAYRQPFTQQKIPGTHFRYRLGAFGDDSAAGRIRSSKNRLNTIGNRNRDSAAQSLVPQPNSLPPFSLYRQSQIFSQEDG
jgi:hypothetical protein